MKALTHRKPAYAVARSSQLLQRKCACGGTPSLGGECEQCRKKHSLGEKPFLQAKLVVNQPGDPFEQEADRIADLVTSRRQVDAVVAPSPAAMLQRDKASIIPAPPLQLGDSKAARSHGLPERKPGGPHGTYQVINPSSDPCSREERCKLFISGSNIDLIQYSHEQEAGRRNELTKRGASTERSPAPEMTAFLKKVTPQASSFIREVLVDPAIGGSGASAWSSPCADDAKATCVTVSPEWEEEARTFNTNPAAPTIASTGGKVMTRTEWQFRTSQMLTHEAGHARFERQPPSGIPKFDGTLSRETISHKELSELFAQLSEFPLFYNEGISGEKGQQEKLGRVRQLYVDRYLRRTMEITEDIPGIILRLRCLNSCSEVDAMLRSVLQSVTQGWEPEVRLALTTILTDPALGLHWPAAPQPGVQLVPEPDGLRFEDNALRRKSTTHFEQPLLQTKLIVNQPGDEALSAVGETLAQTGQALPTATRSLMESRFGHDFSQVRIHTDTAAAESARAVNARAYTVGNQIVFGTGQYQPQSVEGQRLLAHELTHTLQQGVSASALQRYAVPASLDCTDVVDWLNNNSPHNPEWAETHCTYSFGGGANVSGAAEPGGGMRATVKGHDKLSVSVSCPIDRPEWNPSPRPNRTAEVAAWKAMRATLDAHEAQHRKIGQTWRGTLEKRFRAVDFSVTGKDKAEAMANATAELQSQQQQWAADAQTAQDGIDPFRGAVLSCP